MIDFDQMDFHPTSEKLVKILCDKTRNNSPLFFRILVAYNFAKVASMMRTKIYTPEQGPIPINLYAINLAPSGFGKGLSTNVIEEHVINQFRENYTDITFPLQAQTSLSAMALKRAKKSNVAEDIELQKLEREFEACGELMFSFDSATPAAVKQFRHKLLLANAGSLNLEIDEIGSNLLSNVDVLTTYLELYDKGKIKQKLVKNTVENVRTSDIHGATPTNMMLFGTPTKLLDGARNETELMSMFDTGYARRCLIGYIKNISAKDQLTPEEIFALQTDKSSDQFLKDLSDQIGMLADHINMDRVLTIDRDESLFLIKYKLQCERIADALPEHEEIRKAEVTHRYFKTLKLAGAYAFIDGSPKITRGHLENAMKLVEDSGESFKQLLTRDRPYVKLAKYLADIDREITHPDLIEDLPYLPGAEGKRKELINMATAWGYKHGIVIKRHYSDGIEFIRGEKIRETDTEHMNLSFSSELAHNYANKTIRWDKLHSMCSLPNMHWCNHHLNNGHRKEENAIEGFNMVVIDVDEGTTIETAKLLLDKYSYLIHTTKSHRKEKNGVMQGDRFRIVFPLSHTVKLDAHDFKQFMRNVYEWLPFSSDDVTDQRARKWSTHAGEHWYGQGELLDALQFIPKTTKNDARVKMMGELRDMSSLERWFIQNTGSGNRSNNLHRFAMVLVDGGAELDKVRQSVIALNDKLPDKLDESEIDQTIVKSAAKAIYEREGIE